MGEKNPMKWILSLVDNTSSHHNHSSHFAKFLWVLRCHTVRLIKNPLFEFLFHKQSTINHLEKVSLQPLSRRNETLEVILGIHTISGGESRGHFTTNPLKLSLHNKYSLVPRTPRSTHNDSTARSALCLYTSFTYPHLGAFWEFSDL